MARRRPSRPKFHASAVLPIWNHGHTDTVNLAVQALLSKFGITDVPSYFRQLRIPIAISGIVCALLGATNYGIAGFVGGGLLGLLAPVALLYLAVLLVGIAIFLGLYIAAWSVIWTALRWFLAR